MDTLYEVCENVLLQEHTVVGFRYKPESQPAVIGKDSIIRIGTIIYCDVITKDNFQTGHNSVVRENCSFGRYVLIGSGTIVDGNVDIADFVKIESNCYICTHVKIGTRVFIGPNVVFTNDKYPLKMRHNYKPEGPIVEDFVTIGAGSIILPGIKIGQGSFVAAGSVVTKDVPPMTYVLGNPGHFLKMPKKLAGKNIALNWREAIE